MRRAARTLGLGLLLAAGLGACTVTPPELIDEGFFACVSAADCGEGQGCAEGNVYSPDFCRPACDLDDPRTCPDGVCTVSGACLARCTIELDGSSVGCPGEEFTCVRTDALRDEGVCYPVDGCSRSSDCAAVGGDAQLCLNDALGLPSTTEEEGYRFDNLYCTAQPDAEGRCPTGYLSYQFATEDGSSVGVCYPPCSLDGDGPYCPPATTCFRGFGELVGTPDTPPCLPGVWGLPCMDDTQCLIGRCMVVDEDGRRACTETCADAVDGQGGCAGLERFSEVVGSAIRMSCEEVRGVDVCVPRFDFLSFCDDQLDCVGSETTCTEVLIGSSQTAHVCIRECVDAADCAEGTGAVESEYRCVPTSGSSVCMRKRPIGARCVDDLDCLEGVCRDVGDFSACVRENR